MATLGMSRFLNTVVSPRYIVANKMNKVRLSFPVAPRSFLRVLQISMRSGTQEQVADDFIRRFGSLLGFLQDKLHLTPLSMTILIKTSKKVLSYCSVGKK